MSAWYSGVINPSVGKQVDPGALATFGTTLYYIGNGSSGSDMYVTRADLTTPRNLTATSSWSSELLSGTQIAFTNNVQPQTSRRPGLAPMAQSADGTPARLYLFWADSGHDHNDQCYATWTSTANFSGASQWVQGARLYEDNTYKNRLVVSGGGITTVPWGDKIFMVHLSSDGQALQIHLFDPKEINPKSSEVYWAPHWSTSIAASSFKGINSSMHYDNGLLGRDVTATWISYGPDSNRLVVAFFNGDEGEAAVFALPFGSNGHVSTTGAYSVVQTGVHQGAYLQRDPAGRVRLFVADNNHLPKVVTLSTDTDGRFTAHTAATLNSDSKATVQNAQPVIYYLSPSDGSSRLAYEIAVYGKDADSADSTINAQICEYGHVETLVGVETVPYYTYQTQVPWVVSGIMDPFPLASSDVTTITPGRAVMATVYGITEASTTTHVVKESTAYGVKTSGQITLGAGIAWDTAMSAGPTQSSGESSRLTQTKTREGYSGTTSSGGASADIAYFVAGLGITRDACQLRDMNGSVINDGLQMTTVYPTVVTEHDFATSAYAITAGDLNSWTSNSINTTMDRLLPVGSPYRTKYPFTNYVRDVIEANATPLGPNNAKCLSVSLGPASMSHDSYEAVKVAFSETGWTFSDEAYGGLAEAIDAKIFGIGFQSTMQAMVGLTYNVEDTEQTEQETEWAVAVQAQTAAESLSVTRSYTAKMYLLAASPRWVEELRAARPGDTTVQQLDPASAPWRIAYVVELG